MSVYPDLRTALIALLDRDLPEADISLMPIVNATLEAGEIAVVYLQICNGETALLNIAPDNSLLITKTVLDGFDVNEFERVVWSDGRWVALGGAVLGTADDG